VRTRDILIAGGVVLLTLLVGAPVRAAPAAATGTTQPALLDVVLLVDESGSETPQKIADEKAVAGTIVQSLLNPASRVTVVGFGGVNHVVPNQSPVDVVCQPTIATGAVNLSYLASCVNKLHRRTEQEGDDTDYAAALGQAMSYLSPSSTVKPVSPSGALKVILMMTDGAADVHRDTQQYGTDWQLGEQTAINEQMAAAKAAGVQLWPLGFGTDIGTSEQQALAYLNSMAARGAPAVCGGTPAATQPHATWVNNPDDAVNAVNGLYAASGCAGVNAATGSLAGGQQKTLAVSIPAISSSAAISVVRGSPGIQVSFTEPDGKLWTDASAISGSGSSVVVLHLGNITSAEVGTWKITLSAPPGLAGQLVSAASLWQGAVRAIITAAPSDARLGQPISVTLSVLGPDGPVTDPSALKGLVVGVTATGTGLPRPAKLSLASGGGPGIYSATFTAPAESGTITFTGSASGYGLYATQVPQTVTVGTAVSFTAAPQFEVVSSVQVGHSISGKIVLANQTGTSQEVALVLTASGADATVTSPVGPFTVASGNPPSVPFTVTIAESSPAGAAWLNLETVNPTTGAVYGAATLSVTVTVPPGFLGKYLWDILGVVALMLLIVVLLLWYRATIRRQRDVRSLAAVLRRNGEQVGAELKAPSRWSDSFLFIIRDENEPAPRLDYPLPGLPAYLVKRAKAVGQVTLMLPDEGDPREVVVGGPGEVIGPNGLELAFRDTRRRTAGRRGPAPGAAPPEPQADALDGVSPSSYRPPAVTDEWL
jgi:hypothetical protein